MKNIKKAISLLLATVLLLSVVPAAAVDELVDSTASVTTGEGTIGENPVQVTVTKGSSYTITIPKTVILSGSNGDGYYTVKVTGDLSGTETISVVPDASFVLKQSGKNDITATVTQTKTEWSYDNLGDGKGSIKATGLSAGSWQGNFKFNINRIETAITMLEGDGQVVNLFAFNNVRFRSSAPMDTLNEVKINGEVVDPDNYIVTEGSTIITLKNEYVQTLDVSENGEQYKIEIVSKKGTADAGFSVVNLIPEGGRYVDVNGNTYGPNEENPNFPSSPKSGDKYYYGDYVYSYGYVWCQFCDCWSNYCRESWHWSEIDHWAVHVVDNTKTEYGDILTQINGDYISDLFTAFANCSNLIKAPEIPQNVTSLSGTFENCTSLIEVPIIPNSVTDLYGTFINCKSLKTAPAIPDSVTLVGSLFSGCASLEVAPIIPDGIVDLFNIFSGCENLKTYVGSTDPDGDFSNYIIPNGVVNMRSAFSGCNSLTIAPVIPNSVTNLSVAFNGCISLLEAPIIPEGVTDLAYTFSDCVLIKTAPVLPNVTTDIRGIFFDCVSLIEAPALPNNAQYMQEAFKGCAGLTDLSNLVIPSSVVNMESAFENCTSLITAPIIPSNVTSSISKIFKGCSSLTGTIVINTSTYSYTNCFKDTILPITIIGESTQLAKMAATANGGNVTVGN